MLVSRKNTNNDTNATETASASSYALLSVQSPAASTHEQNICPLVKEKACLLDLPFHNSTTKRLELLRLDSNATDVCLVDIDQGTSLWISPFSGRATQVRFAQQGSILCFDKSFSEQDACAAFVTRENPTSLTLLGRGGKVRNISTVGTTTSSSSEIDSITNLGHGSWAVSCSQGKKEESHLWISLKENGSSTAPTTVSTSENNTVIPPLFQTATQASVVPLDRGGMSKLSLFATSTKQDELLAFNKSLNLGGNNITNSNTTNEHASEQRLRDALYLHGKIQNKNSVVFDAIVPKTSDVTSKSLGPAFSFDREAQQIVYAYRDEPSVGVVDFSQVSPSSSPTFRKITPTLGSSRASGFLQKLKGTPIVTSRSNSNLVTHSPKYVSMIASSSVSNSNNDESPQALAVVDLDVSRLSGEHAAWVAVSEGTSTGSGNAGGDGNMLGKPPTTKELKQWYTSPESKPRVKSSGEVKHGEVDPHNTPHVGGNNWAGGTGGTDTAGLGGVVGPYRIDAGHTVHQVPPELKKNVPQHVIDQARRMGKAELQKRLNEIGMTEDQNDQYTSAYQKVSSCVSQVQNLLARLKAREGERVWLRHQSDGTWDDTKLVEGITGDSNIFRRRVDSNNDPALQAKHKKRVLIVADVSASMYRFNGADGRLTRLIESTIMIMEAFGGPDSQISSKVEYSIIGHNGDDDNIEIIPFGDYPRNKMERLNVCRKMIAYAQYCWSGDNTVNAMQKSIRTITSAPADDYFVFVISDANLTQYGITDTQLSRIIRSDERVKMYCLFIASIGSQAQNLQRRLPAGHGFEIRDTRQLPIILQNIFTATDLLS